MLIDMVVFGWCTSYKIVLVCAFCVSSPEYPNQFLHKERV